MEGGEQRLLVLKEEGLGARTLGLREEEALGLRLQVRRGGGRGPPGLRVEEVERWTLGPREGNG